MINGKANFIIAVSITLPVEPLESDAVGFAYVNPKFRTRADKSSPSKSKS